MQEHKLRQMANDKRIVIKLPIDKKVQFYKRAEELNMSPSQFIIHLLNEYDGDHLSVISNFRYNLNKRIRKGINDKYLYELTRLRDNLNVIIEKY